MKRLLLTLALILPLAGCPSQQRAQIAQAAQTASSVVRTFQQSEIVAHQQGVISDADHQVIEKELLTVSTAGKTLDSCIASTTAAAGDIACIQTAVTAVDQINNDGGLYIKSDSAKQTFQVAMAGVKAALVAIEQVIGGGK